MKICENCKKVGILHKHHVVPKVMGGKLVVDLCEDCHSKIHCKKALSNLSYLIKLGIKESKMRGVRFGRPKSEFDINKAIKLKIEGYSWTMLSKELGISSATLRRKLHPLRPYIQDIDVL
jgi:hypothetical protein